MSTVVSSSIESIVGPFVDGAAVESRGGAAVDVIDPSNGSRCLSIPEGCDADIDLAVSSARRAFQRGDWSESSPSFRRKTLNRFAGLVASEAHVLDALDAQEMGKPISEARFNAGAAAELVRFYAEAVDKIYGDVFASDRGSTVIQRQVPRGVVGAVVPWNFPTFNAVLKLAPALAAANSVVLKPSELASRSAMRLAHLALEAGLPSGVFNVVPGLGETVGRALGLHMDVDMVSFTGSTAVGKRMLQYAGQSNMKTVVAECGGKSPHIVFSDGVDVDEVANTVAQLLLVNQGQVCSAGSRLLLQRSIEDSVLERVIARCREIVMGNAMEPETTFGPIASCAQCDRVMRYIDAAKAEGAELVMGGRRVLTESGGYFVEPTIFRGVPPKARIAQEEIFGPVLSVMTFDDEADAIRIANNTMYGLIAYLWTASLSTAMRMVKGIRSSVLVNAVAPRGEGPGHAFSSEPAGQSGVGIEGGLAGMQSYMRRQLVWISHG